MNKGVIDMPVSMLAEFMNKTKLGNLEVSDREKKVPRPPFELDPEGTYETIVLPDPKAQKFADVDVFDAIAKRMSVRDYSSLPMQLSELSFLLWCTQGVKRVIPNVVALRNVPSAGARNAFETFLLVNNVEGLEPGLYKYVALQHELIKLGTGNGMKDEFSAACDEQDQVRNCNVTFIWSAVPYRMTWAYSERACRYLFIDAGHVCQNLYLAAEKLGLGACAIGHFEDDRLNGLLRIDGINQFAIYLAAVGKK
ncbi:MAG: SagB/ThcOx family dehydrogenase [Bacillota bacterium]